MIRKFNKSEISVVLGIGNPDKQYADTFHNFGIKCVDLIAKELAGDIKFKKHSSGYFLYTKVGDLIIAKSLKYMNESGVVAKTIASFFKIRPENIAVIHDDSDLIIGNWKIDFERNSAGHKGVTSIISSLGTKKFWRFRIGIRPQNEIKRQKAEVFVLSRVKDKDAKILHSITKEMIGVLTD